MTDENGRCRRDDILPGSMVTVDARPAGSASPELYTVAGLEPGDDAQIGGAAQYPGESIGTLQISYVDIGAPGYEAGLAALIDHHLVGGAAVLH